MAAPGISLRLRIPVCSFRKGYAREYFESETVPPPSTIYGFLLSLIGEEDRYRHVNARIAYALINQPELSVVLRTTWRIKDKSPPGIGSNRRPDYQEILTGLELGVWIEPSPLAESVRIACESPSRIERYGGLSLGESRDLVNDIELFPTWSREDALWLVVDPKGYLALPVWVDHVGSTGTVWEQFRLHPYILEAPSGGDPRWIKITCSRSGE
jgi:CRISPR-associated protein Cas5t